MPSQVKKENSQIAKAEPARGATRIARYPKWVLAYFVLAAFDLLTVTVSLGLHHHLANIHAEAMTENRHWAARLESFQELQVLIASINAPGNDVFRTGDVAAERERQHVMIEEFRAKSAEVRGLLDAELEDSQKRTLFELLDAFDRTTTEMVNHSGRLFDSFESGDLASAGRHMANMDEEYGRLIALISRIEEASHGFLQQAFDRQGALAADLRYVEAFIAFLVVVMVAGIALYGHRLSRQMVNTARQRQAQLELIEESERRFRELAEGSIQGIVVYRDHERLFANQAWADMHGYGGDAVSDLPDDPAALVAPEDREQVQDVRYALQYGIGERRRYEYRALRRDGTTLWLECLERLVNWRNRPALQSTVIDISERKRMEDDLRNALVQLEHSASARTKFFAAASHDLRQPLHAMSLYLPLLEKRIENEKNRELVYAIANSCDAMRGLLDSLLDISKLDAGAVRPEITEVSARDLVAQLAREFAPQAAAKILELRAAIPADLYVDSDPVLLQRIVRNLLSNAVRYTSHGGILFGARRRGDMLRFEVWDTGVGIPADKQALIFEEFYQADNPERDRSRGLGLGLAIIKRLARLLGHRISVRSAPGRGSAFFVEAPLTERPGLTVVSSQESVEPETDLGGILVILIDDDKDVLQGAQAMFEDWGCDVIAAESGNDAEDQLALDPRIPDIALVDFRLRNEETGIEAIAQIRQATGVEVPAIIVTADTDPARIRQAMESGCMLLHKPVDPQRLRNAMLKTLAEGQNEKNAYKQLVKTAF